MAKLGKQKFNLLGDHNPEKTTFSGTIELYLYYDTEKDYFYFDKEEMKKYLPENVVCDFQSHMFGHCKTKEEAINIIEMLVSSKIKETRKLRIEIGMADENYKIPNPDYDPNRRDFGSNEVKIADPALPQYLRDMLKIGGVHYNSTGLALRFERIMELELNGKKLYVSCDKDWKYSRKHFSGHDFNLINWTPQSEQFLINTQNMLNDMCQVVLKFFNNGDDVNALIKRMENNSNIKLLG